MPSSHLIGRSSRVPEQLTEREYIVAAFKLGMRLSAALISKNVGLVELSPPRETNDMVSLAFLQSGNFDKVKRDEDR